MPAPFESVEQKIQHEPPAHESQAFLGSIAAETGHAVNTLAGPQMESQESFAQAHQQAVDREEMQPFQAER